MSDFTAALKPCVTASVLLTDKLDNVLLIRPADAGSWTIPSSAIAGGESPHDCVGRLVSQQLGLTAIAGRLLVISWTQAVADENPAVVDFLFDGGAVHNEAALAADDCVSAVFRFFSWEQAEDNVSAPLAESLHSARAAREAGGATYLPSVAGL